MRGDLEAALERFHAALQSAPHALEALYPMARVLAENGRKDQALAILDQTEALDESGYVRQVFSAALHYDYGDWDKARSAVEGLGERNILAEALGALIDFETTRRDRLPLHRGALWLSEVAGRLLAQLEARLLEKGQAAASTFHQRLFTDSGTASDSSGAQGAADPGCGEPTQESKQAAAGESAEAAAKAGERTEPFQIDKDWWEALEAAFSAGDHLLVTRLYRRREVPAKWRDVVSGVLNGYSLIALGEGKRALAASRSLLKEHASSAWAHFLAGLAHSALEDRRDAIYSFVRAARRSDIEMHHVVMELARGLKISIELID